MTEASDASGLRSTSLCPSLALQASMTGVPLAHDVAAIMHRANLNGPGQTLFAAVSGSRSASVRLCRRRLSSAAASYVIRSVPYPVGSALWRDDVSTTMIPRSVAAPQHKACWSDYQLCQRGLLSWFSPPFEVLPFIRTTPGFG